MNIKEAKEQIKNAIVAYFTKDEDGEYIIPVEKQRPVFLMGPPGIGKTAIVEQIASEMRIGIISYSMTHHTRQSALGLPFIQHKNYKGMECDVSEYTMSEIVASIYDLMEETGIEEGILFLDEINCVSETLAPVMLQFLQYKVFGRHRIPEGWVVVTAGNPPEYNHSVREFDIVTWDRLKRVDIEPDFDAWKEYAYQFDIHPSVLTYLEIKKADFYQVETTVDGKSFVTARGWDDLSQMIRLYELHGMTVDEKLTRQYLQNPRIAKDFAMYYDLFRKYRSDYQINQILLGQEPEEIRERAKKAKFDERLSLTGLILDTVFQEIKGVMLEKEMTNELRQAIKDFIAKIIRMGMEPTKAMDEVIREMRKKLASGKRSGSMSRPDLKRINVILSHLETEKKLISEAEDSQQAVQIVKEDFEKINAKIDIDAEAVKRKMSNMFLFAEKVFDQGHEMLVIVTELTANRYSSGFIGKYGCDEYFKHNKDLLFSERELEISNFI